MKNPKIEVFGITDAGTVKEINEDSFVYKVVNAGENMAGIFAVADGVGGLQKGDIASKTAISILNKWWEEVFKNHYKDREYLVKSLIRVPEIINTELMDMINKDGIKMATTFSVMLIYKKEAFIVHVGDSRIYKVQKGLFKPSIRQLTQDHSTFVNKEVDGKIFRKNVLTECLGNKEKFNYFSYAEELSPNDLYLLCSDGIYKTQEMQEIKEVIVKSRYQVKIICEELVQRAKGKKERDNISVIAVRICE